MKKVLIFLSLVLLLSFGLTAFASGGIVEDTIETGSTTSITDEIATEAANCSCGNGLLVANYSSWSVWYNDSSSSCSHGYLFGYDMHQKRGRTVTHICNECGYGYSSQQYESRIDCNGR